MSLDFPRWHANSRISPNCVHGPQDNSRLNLDQKRNQPPFEQRTALERAFSLICFSSSSTHLGRVDQLIGQALGNGLDVPEGGLTGSGAQQPHSLVDATQRRHIDGLTTHGTGTTDTGRVFTGSGVHDGQDQDLQQTARAEQNNRD